MLNLRKFTSLWYAIYLGTKGYGCYIGLSLKFNFCYILRSVILSGVHCGGIRDRGSLGRNHLLGHYLNVFTCFQLFLFNFVSDAGPLLGYQKRRTWGYGPPLNCFWVYMEFSLSPTVHAQKLELNKLFLRKSLEGIDTGIVKKLRKFK